MKKLLVGKSAAEDLEQIWDYIAYDSPDAADRWIAKLEKAFDLIARSPGIGHIRTELSDANIRFWPVGSYLILYREREEDLVIEAVTQGSRDIPSFLKRRLS